MDQIFQEFDPSNGKTREIQIPDVSNLLKQYNEKNISKKIGNPFKQSGIFHIVHDNQTEQ